MRNIFAQTALAALVVSVIATKGDAQTVNDGKMMSGASAVVTSCSFSPAIQGPTIGTYAWMSPTRPAADHCTIGFSLVRDHLSGGPLPTIVVHAVQNGDGTGWAHGGFTCVYTAVESGTSPSDSVFQIDGAASTMVYSPTRVAGTTVGLPLAGPQLQPLPSGHTPTWNNGAIAVRCDFGNDFYITDVTYYENGTD